MNPDPNQAPPPAPTTPVPAPTPVTTPSSDAPRRFKEAGTEVKANAAQPRKAAGTNSLRREAEAVFASGGAYLAGATVTDAVGRDKIVYNFGGSGSVRSTTVYRTDAEQVRFVREAFVLDAAYAALLGRARGRNVVIVQGPRGSGRGATGLRLLIDCRRTELLRFPPDTGIAEISGAVKDAGGYLLEDLAERRIRELTALALTDLDARLGSLGAKLIITMPSGATLSDPAVQRFVAPLEKPAAHRAIMESHLRLRLGDAVADELLRDTGLRAVFDDVVTADAARERAAEFALHVEELRVRGRLDMDVLRDRMKSSVTTEVETWFTGLATPSLKYLAIATALLDGLPYQTVVEPAESLERRLTPPVSPVSASAPAADPFATGRAQRVRDIRARIVSAEVPSRLGPVPAEVIRYDHPAYPRAVLDLVWREFDALRGDLLGWLGDLANHPVDAVRVRAAAAVGLLSLTAFEHISKTVLRPWAGDSKENKREMAAYALRAAGRSAQLQQQALALVDEWTVGDSWQRRATAARVYGSALGSSLPERAFEELDRLSATEDADVAFAIGYSLAELIDADRALARQATETALHWMRSRNQGQSATGEIAFLTLAADLVGTGQPGRGDWPLLLQLAAGDRALHQAVARAWEVTLNGAVFHQYAQEIAGDWAELAEPDAEARQRLALLFATVAVGSERTDKIVRWMARNWVSGAGATRAPRTGQAVLAAL